MQQQVDGAIEAVQLCADGVDEEWHVVVDDLDDGVLERPTLRLHGGTEQANVRLARLAMLAELPQRQRAAQQRVEGGVDDVFRRNEREVAPDELLGAIGLIVRNPRPRLGGQSVDEVCFSVFWGHVREVIIVSS